MALGAGNLDYGLVLHLGHDRKTERSWLLTARDVLAHAHVQWRGSAWHLRAQCRAPVRSHVPCSQLGGALQHPHDGLPCCVPFPLYGCRVASSDVRRLESAALVRRPDCLAGSSSADRERRSREVEAGAGFAAPRLRRLGPGPGDDALVLGPAGRGVHPGVGNDGDESTWLDVSSSRQVLGSGEKCRRNLQERPQSWLAESRSGGSHRTVRRSQPRCTLWSNW
mmetsp:Transcript_62263/g.146133  ORF Transcript_62263/g.146133 Transcript_62263/m.146133 type:complete len:223 (-) Transcript_62263:735-1403(-)